MSDEDQCLRRCGNPGTRGHHAGDAEWRSRSGKPSVCSQVTKRLPGSSALRYALEGDEGVCPRRNSYVGIHSNFMSNSHTPSVHPWWADKQNVGLTHSGMSLSHRKEGGAAAVWESPGHRARCEAPGTKHHAWFQPSDRKCPEKQSNPETQSRLVVAGGWQNWGRWGGTEDSEQGGSFWGDEKF